MSESAQLYLTLVVYALPGILAGFVLHELAHAAVATRLGDPTPRRMGRLTLDPRRHVDPLGLAMLLLVGFGFARPVVYSPRHVRTGPRRAAVAAAGPLANLVLAGAVGVTLHLMLAADSALPFRLDTRLLQGGLSAVVFFVLLEAFYVNVVLCVFNTLPIPGLDGFVVAEGLLGRALPEVFTWMSRNRQWIYAGALVLVFALPQVQGGSNPLGSLVGSVNDHLWHWFVSADTTVRGGLPTVQLLLS